MLDEIFKLGVFKRIFFEIGFNTNLKNFPSKQEKGLVEPCSSFTI